MTSLTWYGPVQELHDLFASPFMMPLLSAYMVLLALALVLGEGSLVKCVYLLNIDIAVVAAGISFAVQSYPHEQRHTHFYWCATLLACALLLVAVVTLWMETKSIQEHDWFHRPALTSASAILLAATIIALR